MAIKGKKKNKGSAGAKRPAGAPRPQIPTTRRKRSFWRTRDGILILAVFALVGIGTVVWLVAESRSEAALDDERRAALEQYTSSLKPILGDIDDEVAEMTALTGLPPEDEIGDLAKDAEKWMQSLQNATMLMSQRFPAEDIDAIGRSFDQSVGLYFNAASLLATLDGIELSEKHRGALFNNFATQRDLATGLLGSTIATFDQFRLELGMERSGLQAPAASAPPTAPPTPEATPEATPASPPADDDSDSKKKNKKKTGGEDSNG